jgi:membrane protein YqaA with SNARE-associated domain
MKILARFEKFGRNPWYPLLVALLAALDAFVIFIPNDALLISAVLARPQRWVSITFWVTLGSAVGAAIFGFLASRYGTPLVHSVFPKIMDSKTWAEAIHVIHRHGSWGLAAISFSPLPQHAAVAIAGLAHLSYRKIFLAVLLGRLIKYLIIARCSLHAPHLLRKFGIMAPKSV